MEKLKNTDLVQMQTWGRQYAEHGFFGFLNKAATYVASAANDLERARLTSYWEEGVRNHCHGMEHYRTCMWELQDRSEFLKMLEAHK